jgi:DNA-directed RNA polymerase specialized sigma24 family protein
VSVPGASLEGLIAAAVESAVARAVAPLVAELARLRATSEAEGVPLEEAARRLHCSIRTIQRRVKAGELPAVPGMRPPRIVLSALTPEEP